MPKEILSNIYIFNSNFIVFILLLFFKIILIIISGFIYKILYKHIFKLSKTFIKNFQFGHFSS